MGQGAAPAEWPPNEYVPVAGQRPLTLVESGEPGAQQIQAAAEGVVQDDGDRIEFFGQYFRLAERVGLMPMLAFANASKKGLDSDDMEGLAAMYALIRSVIHRPPLYDEQGQRAHDESGKALRDESEWHRFEELADDEQAEGEDVMDFVNKAMSVIAARPRKPREVSSATSRPTSERSKDALSSQAMPPGAEGLTPVAQLGR